MITAVIVTFLITSAAESFLYYLFLGDYHHRRVEEARKKERATWMGDNNSLSSEVTTLREKVSAYAHSEEESEDYIAKIMKENLRLRKELTLSQRAHTKKNTWLSGRGLLSDWEKHKLEASRKKGS